MEKRKKRTKEWQVGLGGNRKWRVEEMKTEESSEQYIILDGCELGSSKTVVTLSWNVGKRKIWRIKFPSKSSVGGRKSGIIYTYASLIRN